MAVLISNSLTLDAWDCAFFFTERTNTKLMGSQIEMIARSLYLTWFNTFGYDKKTEFDIHLIDSFYDGTSGSFDPVHDRLTFALDDGVMFASENHHINPLHKYNDTASHEGEHRVQLYSGKDLDSIPNPRFHKEEYFQHPLELSAIQTALIVDSFLRTSYQSFPICQQMKYETAIELKQLFNEHCANFEHNCVMV